MKQKLFLLGLPLTVFTCALPVLTACSLASKLTQHERQVQKLEKLKNAADLNPAKHRVDYVYKQQQLINEHLAKAEQARRQGQLKDTLQHYQQVLDIDSQNVVAKDGIYKLNQLDQIRPLYELAQLAYQKGNFETALAILKEVIQTAPDAQDSINLRFTIEREMNRRLINPPQINERLSQFISLEFRNAPVQAVLELLSQHSGINFILDKDTKLDQVTTTIYAKNTSVQEALEMIMRTSDLSYKALNANTFLIYQNNLEKRKQYDELITRSFYLATADAQRTQEMINRLYEPKSIFFDSHSRILIVRDTQSVIESIEKLIQAYDLPIPEVLLDIEILEVNRDKLLGLGIDFPNQIGVRALNGLGAAGNYTVNQIQNLTTNSLQLVLADPIATVNFKQTSSNTNLLANPRIRVKSKEDASFLIGDKVPVITTTTSQISGAVSESISYLDVGLKVEVSPEVNKDRQVQIAVKLEVSNIAKEIRSSTGLVAYQIGTRNAATTLQLQDGETQMLAGLIRDDTKSSATHLPGLGKIPLLGRLFSNTADTKNKSEIVLLITPRIVRPYLLPAPYIQEFVSGTGRQVSNKPLRLTDQASYLSKPVEHAEDGKISPEPVQGNSMFKKLLDLQENPLNTSITPLLSEASLPVGINPLKITLSGPNNVAPGQEFTLALVQDSPVLENLSVDLSHSEELELVRTVLVAPSTKLDQEKISQGTRLSFGRTGAHQGPSALLIFKVPETGLAENYQVKLEQGRLQFNDGHPAKEFRINETKAIHVSK